MRTKHIKVYDKLGNIKLTMTFSLPMRIMLMDYMKNQIKARRKT